MDKFNNVEGLVLPNEPLTNFQLIEAAKKLKITNFRGVFVRDQLPNRTIKKECGILNTGVSSTNGFHWICWYKDDKVKHTFDSYSQPPPSKLVEYLRYPVYYNSERVQFGNTYYCGHLCLYFLKKLDEGYDFQDIIENLLNAKI